MPKLKETTKYPLKMKRGRYNINEDIIDPDDYSEYEQPEYSSDNYIPTRGRGNDGMERMHRIYSKKRIKRNNFTYKDNNDEDEQEDIFDKSNAFKKDKEPIPVKNPTTASSNTFDVEYICGKKYSYELEKDVFYVKWMNFSYEENTWEPLSNLQNVLSLVNNFELYQSKQLFWNQIKKTQPKVSIKINGYKKPKHLQNGSVNGNNNNNQKSNNGGVNGNSNNKLNGNNNQKQQNGNGCNNKLSINKLINISDNSSSSAVLMMQNNQKNNLKFMNKQDLKIEKKEEEKAQKQLQLMNNELQKFEEKNEEKVEEKYIQQLPQKILDNLKSYGTFLTDTPLKIVKHKSAKNFQDISSRSRVLYYKVEWKEREDGFTPLKTYYKYEQLYQECPQILLQYYVENAVLFDNKEEEKEKKEEKQENQQLK